MKNFANINNKQSKKPPQRIYIFTAFNALHIHDHEQLTEISNWLDGKNQTWKCFYSLEFQLTNQKNGNV